VIDVWRGAVLWSEISELDDDAQRLIEIVLATNESLVAYRRRYRSDVEFVAAVELVVSDPSNPRSAAFAIATVRDEVDRLGWTDGQQLSSELFDQLQQSRIHTPAATARALDDLYRGCDRLARDLVTRYLASPVDPQPMGAAT
jgi:uncharacterized alpha-E superfamily protein